MKISTITIIKDVAVIAFIALVLITTISDWWTILGIVMLFSNYKSIKS